MSVEVILPSGTCLGLEWAALGSMETEQEAGSPPDVMPSNGPPRIVIVSGSRPCSPKAYAHVHDSACVYILGNWLV